MAFFENLHQFGDWGLLVLRFSIGVIFIAHGWPKIMGAKTMAQAMGKQQMAGFLTFLGFAEAAGALAMFSGFLTQLAAIGLGIIMIGAIGLKVSMMKSPFTSHDKMGWDFDFIILAACAALLLTGAGGMSIDRVFFRI